jgi:hypothetical protein
MQFSWHAIAMAAHSDCLRPAQDYLDKAALYTTYLLLRYAQLDGSGGMFAPDGDDFHSRLITVAYGFEYLNQRQRSIRCMQKRPYKYFQSDFPKNIRALWLHC